MTRVPHSLAAVLCLSSLAAASQIDFPLDVVGVESSVDALRCELDRTRVQALLDVGRVLQPAVMLPDGRMVDLELERIDLGRSRFRFYVDGVEQGDLLAGLDLSVWKGFVRGEEGSEAMLSFSQVGAQGWIRSGGELVHLTPRPDASGSWWNGDVLMVSEASLNKSGMALDDVCTATATPGRAPASPVAAPGSSSSSSGASSSALLGPNCSVRECRISLETDFQYYQRFNDVNAQAAYTATLWSFIGDRYLTQANTVLTFPYVGFYTNSSDPWTTPDGPGSSGDMLNEFRGAWLGAVPNGGHLGHFMSGASLGGGVAWLDVLCNPDFGFAVSGNINGTISFPIVQQPNNWDFMVCAHEVGHNFDALHTHDYCPPLDECPPSQYFGQCQTQQSCTSQGTIMSYCHLCSGGTANITTFFHPTSAQFMTQAAANCLPELARLSGDAPSVLAANTATPVTASVIGTPVGDVQLLWRANSASAFSAIAMTSQGGGAWSASLPAFSCGDSPQYYYAYTDQACGAQVFPAGSPASALGAVVGVLQPSFADDFQSDLGWTATNLGASSGDWQRGVPVNDPNWAYDPSSDGDGSGSCWLTQNALGNTDVDNGAVQLLSPALDLTGMARIDYLYYLRLTNSNGDDRLLVEISANGAAGPWVEIARHDQDRGSAWTAHTIFASEVAGAGVALGANMRLRFIANDSGTQSIVEAGLDGFGVSSVSCSGVGVNYCASLANSSGAPAVMSASGSNSLAANDLALHAAPVPTSSNGIFYFGANTTQAPFGNGIRCVAAPTVRFPSVAAAGGSLDRAIDNTQSPASVHFLAGATLNFQAWFRDAAAGGASFNLSDGYRITFTP